MSITINWILKPFGELTPVELYDLLRLRSEVFVVEQNCVFLDMDNQDQEAWHLLGYVDNKPAACSRLIDKGKIYKEISIGRIATSFDFRGSGIGRELVSKSIKEIYNIYDKSDIRIGAQLYLERFYNSFGFDRVSDVYLEDGIEHIYMLKKYVAY